MKTVKIISNKIAFLSVLSLGFLLSCQPEIDNKINDQTYYSGEANFSSFVALGNSLTAGSMDGSVFKKGQALSFPNILAGQFSLVGGGNFTQPSFSDDTNNLGGLLLAGTPIQPNRLIFDLADARPEPIAGSSSIETSNLQAKAYHNMGVPGAKSFHLLAPGYGNLSGLASGTANPYFVRHATSPSTTVIADAMSLNPTFFSLWIGSNDVLSYATNGGTGTDQTGNLDPTTYASNDITDPMVFAQVYNNLVNTLTSNNAKGVLSTIPYVTSIPYFTTVPYNPIPSELTSTNATLNQLFGFLALATGGRIQPLSITAGTSNPVLIQDETLPDLSATITAAANASGNPALTSIATPLGQIFGKARHAKSSDLIVLTASVAIGAIDPNATAPFNVLGVSLPLDDQWVLIPSEQNAIKTAVDAYNTTIKSIAASKNLALFDANHVMQKLASSLRIEDGQIYTSDYFNGDNISTVLFSLDGVHPNARGYAVIANEIIKTINSYYKANIPLVVAGSYPGATLLSGN